jgi:hydrogenase nickel incorporation protein HypB
MCTTCGCDEHEHEHEHGHAHEHGHEHAHEHGHEHEHEPRRVRFERDLLAKNDALAAENRRMLEGRSVAVLNLIGSPGAGKTTLLERTIERVRDALDVCVLEGDQATDRDAQRIRRAGCRAVQVTTGAGCHLDATMIRDGVAALEPKRGGVVFVENVGNLVCPALFDLGERAKVVVMSVTEGDDKPLKYPHVFRAASRFVLTKTDLLPYVDFDVEACVSRAKAMNPRVEVLRVSARTGEGLDAFCAWIRKQAASA